MGIQTGDLPPVLPNLMLEHHVRRIVKVANHLLVGNNIVFNYMVKKMFCKLFTAILDLK